jgi:hypothetical protein
MAESHVIYALKAKRQEISGYIDHLNSEIAQARAHLVHVDATLRLFGYELSPEDLPPKYYSTTAKLFDRGELQRTLFDLLRANPIGMTVPDLTDAIIAKKEWDGSDGHFKAALGHKISNTLLKLRNRRLLLSERSEMNGRINIWRLPE